MHEPNIEMNLRETFSLSKLCENERSQAGVERSGERRLWLAVLHNYFYEVFATESFVNPRLVDKTAVFRKLDKLEREAQTDHFGMICDFAGFDHSYIKRKVKFIIGKIRENIVSESGPYFKELSDRTKALRRGNRSRQRFGSQSGTTL